MDPYVEVRCKFGELETVFKIANPCTFKFFTDVVRAMFPQLSMSPFSASYSIPGHPTHLLESDNDMEYMYAALTLVESNTVDITIGCDEIDISSLSAVVDVVNPPIDTAPDFDIDDPTTEPVLLSHEWASYMSHVNQEFPGGAEVFRKMVKLYATELGFTAKFKKNEFGRVTAVCSKKESQNCEWHVHVVLCRYNGNFKIKKLNNEHTCIGRLQGKWNKMMTSKVVASLISETIAKEPHMAAKHIVRKFKESYGVELPYWNAWYGREVARADLHGDDEHSYKILVRYCKLFMDTNPGSLCYLEVDNNTHRFQRLFIAPGGCIQGFNWCRPMLCLDATFLKHKFKGTLMAATAKNGDSGIYPLCYAVVDAENTDNWAWFTEKLAEILNPQGRIVTFISYRNQGLLDAVKHVFLMSPHAYCLFHLKNNLRAKLPGAKKHDEREKLVEIFNKCVYAYKSFSFKKFIQELIGEGKEPVEDFLRYLPPVHWANAYFPGQRYGEMSSNIVESFNSWIVAECHLPITQLVDGVRAKMMRLIGERQAKSYCWKSVLCPEQEKLLLQLNKKSRNCLVCQAGDMLFEVSEKRRFSVNLDDRTCSCERWRITGFICVHAIAVVRQIDANVYDFIDPYLRADVFRKLYTYPIYPVPSVDDDEPFLPDEVYPLPPITKKQPGRPRNGRIKSSGELVEPLRQCSRCKQFGRHNRRTCAAAI